MNRRSFIAIPTTLAAAHFLAGCAGPQNAPQSAPLQPTPLAMSPIEFIIPEDPSILTQHNGPEGIRLYDERWGVSTRRESIRLSFVGDDGVIERRTDNGVAGSGQKVRLKKHVTNISGLKRIKYTPYDTVSYQQGLMLQYPVPRFEPNDIKEFFLSGGIRVKIEADSEFNPDSTYANFVRILKSRQYGQRDPVSGKIYKQEFLLPLRGKQVSLFLETYPYRNGSKAVAYCIIPSVETSANTVDFRLLLTEVREALSQVLKS